MAKSSKSQYAILGMLALLKKSSGYDLIKHMESTTQYFWKETFSSIYPVLEDLEKQKLITKVDTTKKNDRKRNVYTLTAEGRNKLKDWLLLPPEDMQMRNEFLLKLFFGNMVPPEVTIAHIEQHKQELAQKLAFYKAVKVELADLNSKEFIYSMITLDHGIRLVQSSLEWCDAAISTLKSLKSK